MSGGTESNSSIGDYAVLAKLGQGGFGIIYRVRSLSKYHATSAGLANHFSFTCRKQ